MATGIDFALRQRGRASVDFLTCLGAGGQAVRAKAKDVVDHRFPDPSALPEDLDERHALIESSIADAAACRAEHLLGEWHSSRHGIVAEEAFQEVRDTAGPMLKGLDEGPTTLEADDDFVAPDYWDGVEFHRTAGAWDGYEYAGSVHAEIVHRRMVDRLFPGGIFRQRRQIAAMAPREHYARILDMGCSTGHFTLALADCYPDAEIHGVDLSLRTLEHARRVANARGYAWKLYRRPAEATGFADNSFDLVASYILLHEIPAETIRAVFREAFRVLEPGGDMIMSDVTRYADMDRLGQWRADRGARYGGEPHWRASASLDLAAEARAAGFEEVSVRGLEPANYPYIVMGRKPR